MTGRPARPEALVLYDEDCGFCRWTLAKLLAWDRQGRLHPGAIQSAEGRRLLAGLSEEEMLASWHLIRDGRRHSAGAAFAPPLAPPPPGGGAPPPPWGGAPRGGGRGRG